MKLSPNFVDSAVIGLKYFKKQGPFITQKFELLRQYLDYTIGNMKQYETIIEKYDKYGEFYKDIKNNREKLEDKLRNVDEELAKKIRDTEN